MNLRQQLCEGYFGEKLTPALLARMELWAVLANVGWSLYCAIQAVVTSDEDYWEGATGYWKEVVDALDSEDLPLLLRAVATA